LLEKIWRLTKSATSSNMTPKGTGEGHEHRDQMMMTEDFEDTMTEAARLVEASQLFSRASVRAFRLLGSIATMRETIKKTMPLGQEALESQNIETVLGLLADPKSSKIFKDSPEKLMQDEKYVEVAKDMTQRSMGTTTSLVSAAALVFAHAVFDATLFDFCRVTALQSWRDWLEFVKDRKVSVAEIDATTKVRTLLNAVDKHVKRLENESVLTKADMLHQVIKPGKDAPSVRDYAYSREKLKAMDHARHGAVHRLEFEHGVEEIDATAYYLLQTLLYFMALVNFRYGLKIDANIDSNPDGPKST
jgi:hypothetical protein